MSEPQNDEYVEEIQHVETNDSVSDSETDVQVQDESNEQAEPIVDEVEVAKQKANDAFNKQYGEKKQLERELEAQKARVAEFENKQREEMAANVGNIPALPDAFDDDYEQKIQARDEAIRAQAQFNYSQQSHQQAQQAAQQQAAQARDGYELASMSPFAVGQFLDGIKQKASALKPKTSNAPKPATNLQGNGVDPEAGKYRNLKGTRYE